MPAIATSSDNTRTIATERMYRPALNRRGVLYCHGAGGTQYTAFDPQFVGQHQLIRELAAVHPVDAADLVHGATWGDPTSVAALETERVRLGAVTGALVDTVHLVGVSMGCMTALNYARTHPTRVASITLGLAVVDLDHVYRNDVGGQRAAIAAMWGIAYPAALPAGADPSEDPAAFAGFSILACYVTNDPYCPAPNLLDFAAGSGAAIESLGALGHTETALAAIDPADVLAHMEAND